MWFFAPLSLLLAAVHATQAMGVPPFYGRGVIAPKVMVISLFAPEAEVWYKGLHGTGLGDLMARNISAPGLSMLFPHVHCVASGDICQMTTGESEINAASSVMAMALSRHFDLRKTYFLVAGIAGVNPARGTLGSVALARYTVQVALQYEIDAREMPANWPTGYFGYGTDEPNVQPGNAYGTEVLEVNVALRDRVAKLAAKAQFATDSSVSAYCKNYKEAAATAQPSVLLCDSATSDVYFSGALLGDAFDAVTRVWTNGTGKYCMTAQEDSAVLEVLLRLAIDKLVDFGRVMVLRSGSDFDRPPPGVSAFNNLRIGEPNAFDVSITNLFKSGVQIVQGILAEWDDTYAAGIAPSNYIGDIFGSLGGTPDFGPGSTTGGKGYLPDGASCTTWRWWPKRGRFMRRRDA